MKKGLVLIVAVALLTASCTGGPNNASAMTNETPTAAAIMVESASSTSQTMMSETTPTTEAMMSSSTPVGEAMMANVTPTTDAMMPNGAPTTQAMMAEGTPTGAVMMESGTPTAESMMTNSTPGGTMMGSELMGISLMDVNSGKSIPLSNYTGKVVLISLFSTSCTDCLQQQKTLESLNMQNQNGLVVVTLDVDPKDNAGVLANFARQNNYHWVFGNSTDTINQGLNKLYNSQSINPTALQTLVIDRMGDVHALPNGMKSSSELSQDLASYLAAQ